MASYYLCKWEAEWVLQQAQCDCESHLLTYFGNEEGGIKATGIKTLTQEYLPECIFLVPAPITYMVSRMYAEYPTQLLQPAIIPEDRPPGSQEQPVLI